MEEVGALLAGGMSGHICFKDRWNGFNDALYTAARLLEVLGSDPRNSSDIFDGLPAGISTPLLRVAVPESEKYRLVERLGTEGYFPGSEVMRVDGVRVEFAEGWGMVRPSNRQACLVLRFEAETDAELAHIQGLFREQLLMLAPGLQLPF
jgi:phosphomannomutase/phosphoglucomutase